MNNGNPISPQAESPAIPTIDYAQFVNRPFRIKDREHSQSDQVFTPVEFVKAFNFGVDNGKPRGIKPGFAIRRSPMKGNNILPCDEFLATHEEITEAKPAE